MERAARGERHVGRAVSCREDGTLITPEASKGQSNRTIGKGRSIMMRALIAAGVAALGLADDSFGQQRWSVEVRGGPAIATQELGGAELEAGFGFEATGAFRFMPHASAYAGWDWQRFPAETSPAGPDMDFEETGYAFGVQFDHPFRGEIGGAGYRLRLGGTYNHIEVESSSGDRVTDSGHGLGWEIGTGVIVPFGDAWRVTPGLRYRSLGRTLTFGAAETDVDLTYVSLEVGFARRF
jgi:hypothetical protein